MKTNFSQEQLNKIMELFYQDFGSRKIAKILGCNRSTIIRAYKQLNLDSKSKKVPRYAFRATEKFCRKCNQIKLVKFFRKRIKDNRCSYEAYCLDCEKIYNYKRACINSKKLRETSPNFVLKRSLSYSIWKNLKINNSSKHGNSCLNFLPYTVQELKEHLESKFESWMNWNNHGVYKIKEWNDNDPKTWKWQVDHIIPQSNLPYQNMEENNFKICWSLENLRPYSAKQNILDGANRIRHNKI